MYPRRPLDQPEIDQAFATAYAELRRLAGAISQQDRNSTLNPTALVNEAWIRLKSSPGFAAESPLHFKRIAARAMRQILVEAARRRQAAKRGGDGGAGFVALSAAVDAPAPAALRVEDVLTLENALHELEELNPRQAQLVEARFFGGFEVSELVESFGVSEATVMRDWRMARAWLAHRIGDASSAAAGPAQ